MGWRGLWAGRRSRRAIFERGLGVREETSALAEDLLRRLVPNPLLRCGEQLGQVVFQARHEIEAQRARRMEKRHAG
jgi:hypothetical protein